MAAGKPVVATNVGGTSEAIVDGATGILVPPRNVDALTMAIVSLVDDIGLQKRLGEAGRERARKNYTIDKYVSRLDEMYRYRSGINVGAPSTELKQGSHN